MNKRICALFLIPVLMFGFGYLMVPIYDVFCDLTGLNGKTGVLSAPQASRLQADPTRIVKVEFMANLNSDMPLSFAPTVPSMQVHPGMTYQATYSAKNERKTRMIGQAVPSVSPSKAASYFNKIECFCFSRQAFAAEEQRELPLIFVVDPDLPSEVNVITLSYTFFDVTESAHDNTENGHMEHGQAQYGQAHDEPSQSITL